jgi:hypothetical protein
VSLRFPLSTLPNHDDVTFCSKVTELQQEHADYLAQKKAEALDAVALMEDYVARKVEQERTSEGK